MSLILEALRKSEAERRRGNTPDVAMELPPVPLRARQSAPSWLWPVLLAAIVGIAVAWWLAGRRDADAPAAATTPAVATDPVQAEPQAPAVVPRAPTAAAVGTPSTDIASAPASEAPSRATAAAPVAARTEAASTSVPAPVREIAPPQPPITPPPAPMPTAAAMSGVKLSMHMWDASADKRFVILNGQRMGEGDRNGDVQVIAIERDGVVVERDGQRARVALP